MARIETDRDDLFAEAAALSPKAEWTPDPDDPATALLSRGPIVVGLRSVDARGGAYGLSLYDGADRVDHFSTRGGWRRAFRDGELVKAERGTLVGLTRVRDDRSTDLIATVWPSERIEAERRQTADRLSALIDAWRRGSGRFGRVEPLPAEASIERLLAALESLPQPLRIAEGPGLVELA